LFWPVAYKKGDVAIKYSERRMVGRGKIHRHALGKAFSKAAIRERAKNFPD
jgi:hypothetical protein